MIHDARALPDGIRLEADVCIVGGGAAGIALALELRDSPLRVCLLESGGHDYDPDIQDLARGHVAGRRYYKLHTTRLRLLGGSTNHWGGKCRPLDPIDFAHRPWIPHSGWPLDRAQLDPYYRRAQRLCRLGPFEYEPAYWEEALGTRVWPFDSEVLRTRIFLLRPLPFGRAYRRRLERAENVDVYLHASATGFELDAAGERVAAVEARALAGRGFRVGARRFVLAAGGIENPRLLLLSNGRRPAGLGNQHDLVGRFFMDHIWCPWGRIRLSDPRPPARLYRDPPASREVAVHAGLSFTEAVMEAESLSNFATIPLLEEPAQPGVEGIGAPLAAEISEMDRADRAAGDGSAAGAVLLRNYFEQVPDPESRVTLADDRDALGQRRIRLRWRLGEIDRRTLRRAHEILAAELGRLGLGRLRLEVTDDLAEWPPTTIGGHHHMGTTRMSRDPRRGVVDADCRVHGVPNLYVAGSSVFPTSGYANPTLTLLALAIRLADHLKARGR